MSPPATSVVIVSHRPGRWLAEAVESVVGQADQVVVVDNGSAHGEAAQVAAGLGVTTVSSRVNAGFAGGVTMGLAVVTGDVVGVLNDDAVAGPTWLASAAALLADPTIAAVTPKVVLARPWLEVVLGDAPWRPPGDPRDLGRQLTSVLVDGEECIGDLVGDGVHPVEIASEPGPARSWQWTTGGRRPFYVPAPDPVSAPPVVVNGEPVEVTGPPVRLLNHAGSFLLDHGVAGERGAAAPDDGRFDEPADVFGFSGTAPVFRSEVLADLGAFSRPFFAYNEDTDWCLRAQLAGLRIRYDPSTTVRHRLSATSGGVHSRRVQLLAQRNALLCLARNAPTEVALRHWGRNVRSGPADGVRAAALRRLPWAVATRAEMSRRWQRSPADVWAAWLGVGSSWDASPARR